MGGLPSLFSMAKSFQTLFYTLAAIKRGMSREEKSSRIPDQLGTKVSSRSRAEMINLTGSL